MKNQTLIATGVIALMANVSCRGLLTHNLPKEQIRNARVVPVENEPTIFLFKGTCPISSMRIPTISTQKQGEVLVVVVVMGPGPSNPAGIDSDFHNVVFPFRIDSNINAIAYETADNILWRRARNSQFQSPPPGGSNHSMHQTLPLRGIAGDFES